MNNRRELSNIDSDEQVVTYDKVQAGEGAYRLGFPAETTTDTKGSRTAARHSPSHAGFPGLETSTGQAFGWNRCSSLENADGRRSDKPMLVILGDVQ
jgi:hypothetical protein